MPIERRLGSRSEYTPYALTKYHTEDEIRQEYMRMRRTLQDRARRIERSGEFPDSYTHRSLSYFPPQSQLTQGQVAMRLSDLESMLERQTSTLTGLREERASLIETFQDRGYRNINKSNINEFLRFMNATQPIVTSVLRYKYVRGQATGPDRNKRLEMFNTAQSKGITTSSLIRDFRFYANHLDEIRQLPDRPTGRKLGIKSIRRMLKS